jgi:hypothetical protein
LGTKRRLTDVAHRSARDIADYIRWDLAPMPDLPPMRRAPAASRAATAGAVCRTPRGSLRHPGKRIAYRLGCGRWSCPACARRKAKRLEHRFASIRWRRRPALVTFTAGDIDHADPTPAVMGWFNRQVGRVRRWVERRVGKFNWAAVREISPRHELCVCHELRACRCGAGGGRLHVHMLWDAPYVNQTALSAACGRCRLGYVVDIRRAKAKGAARYLAKYLAKDAAHPAFRGRRRFSMRAPEPKPEPSEWRFDWRPPSLIAVQDWELPVIEVEADGVCDWPRPATAEERAGPAP